jgi:hypothetical protein
LDPDTNIHTVYIATLSKIRGIKSLSLPLKYIDLFKIEKRFRR